MEGEGGELEFPEAEADEPIVEGVLAAGEIGEKGGVDGDAKCCIAMQEPGEEAGGEGPAAGGEPAEAGDYSKDMAGLSDDRPGAEHAGGEVHWRSAQSSRRWRWPAWR